MKKPLLIVPVLAVPALAGVVLFAGGASAPHDAVLDSVQAARNNDVAGLLHNSLTDEEYREMKAGWDLDRAAPADPQEDFSFNMALQMLTAEGAEDVLFAQVQPKLQELRSQAGFLSGMATGMAQAQLDENASLTVQQQEDAQAFLEGVSDFLSSDRISDPARARRAIEALCAAARQLDCKTATEFRALEFEELLGQCDIVMAATKDVLAAYDYDVDGWLDSIDARTVSESEATAKVMVSYALFGNQRETEAELYFADGRWIGKRK